MENLAQVQSRLANIQSVLPLLGALRTISLGRWQTAQKQRRAQQAYEAALLGMLPWLLPRLPANRAVTAENLAAAKRIVIVALGSERGLCGQFNTLITRRVASYRSRKVEDIEPANLIALGSRLGRLFQQQGEAVARIYPLPKNAAGLVDLAFALVRQWLHDYEVYRLDAVDLIYNTYHGLGRYEPTIVRLIPPDLSSLTSPRSPESSSPPIIETDPLSLYRHLVEQWIALKLYGGLLESAMAEHSARFQLMEAATQNAERLIDELTVAVQMARRQAITQETQALAVGAGLLGSGRQ